MKKIIRNYKCKRINITSEETGFFRGDVLKNKPNGYGIFIIFDDNEVWQSINMPTQISYLYLGEWKNGVPEGSGRFLSYSGFEYNPPDKYGMPTLLGETTGNFKNGDVTRPFIKYQFPEKNKWSCFRYKNFKGKSKIAKIKNKDSYIAGLFTLKEVATLINIDLNLDRKALKEEFAKRYKIMTEIGILKNNEIMDIWKSNIIPSNIKPNTKFNLKLLYLLIQIPIILT